MYKWITALALGLMATLTPTAQAAEGGRWVADFDEAVKLAKAEKKDLLVDFTGSDWCGWCIKLHEEVFSHESFYAEAEKDFVLVALDFPHDEAIKAKVPNPERNRELANLYGVSGYPTVLVINTDGKVLGRTGYQKGGPEKYLTHVNTLAADGKLALVEILNLVNTYESAEGKAKNAAFEAVLAGFEQRKSDDIGMLSLANILRSHLAADADDAKGQNVRVIKALLGKGQADDEVKVAARKLDPKNEKGLLEVLVAMSFKAARDDASAHAALDELEALIALGPIKDDTLALDVYYNAAYFCFKYLDMPEDATKYAKLARPLCPEDDQERIETLDHIINS